MNTAPLLEMRNASFSYSDDVLALHEVSLGIYAGERIAVLGNNGAGKSTFFLCCNGVHVPQKGELLLEGEQIGHSKKDILRLCETVGLVFQEADDQIIGSTVEAEVSFGPMNLRLGNEEVQTRVDEALDALDLESYRERPPHYVSGGEKKLVTIADILAMKPRVILFDEPTSSLDPQNKKRFHSVLDTLSDQGLALLVATHDIDFAYAWASRVLVFHEGHLVADRTSREVFSDRDLLETAGLEEPMLYTMAKELCEYKGLPLPNTLPLRVEDIPEFLSQLDEWKVSGGRSETCPPDQRWPEACPPNASPDWSEACPSNKHYAEVRQQSTSLNAEKKEL